MQQDLWVVLIRSRSGPVSSVHYGIADEIALHVAAAQRRNDVVEEHRALLPHEAAHRLGPRNSTAATPSAKLADVFRKRTTPARSTVRALGGNHDA